eukprot:TRINITY_DN120850_c0_g1_i1.p2 TRINITY_DN120850_c0_g1~~TRINITY_DN120850_c0_g1_i1.p2  ORF type:complete len:631 (+),score=162.07 TRINITY_DN120850_c0_g1_i1:90-1895(+)
MTSRDVDIGFSDNRFLQRVLQEAHKGQPVHNQSALANLQRHGFSEKVSQIALSVAGGDEKRAMEICMSGLSFMGSPGNGLAHDNCNLIAPEKISAPPAPLKCYICSQQYLSERTLDIHLKACRRRFEQREAKRPPERRRPLLEEADLPPGVDCLERFYELADKQSGEAAEVPAKKAGTASPRQPPPDMLLPCRFCTRTFAADRLGRHVKACVERPKVVDPPTPSSSSTSRRKSLQAPSGPPPAAEKAYSSFVQQLSQCAGCGRQFRNEVLAAHMKVCEPAKDLLRLQEKQRRRASLASATAARSAQRQAAAAVAVEAAAEGAFEEEGECTPRKKVPVPSARRRASTSTGPPGMGTPKDLTFTPPARMPVPAPAPPAGAGKFGKRHSVPAALPVEAELTPAQIEALCIDAFLKNGEVIIANPADEDILRVEFESHLPSGEFLGAYQVAGSRQIGIYEAMRQSMRAQMTAVSQQQPAEERELWHGTSWTIVGKILKQGFNRSFAGRHGTLLGVATYFSTDLSYSNRFCDKRGGGRDKTKVMILARVLVGNYCKGAPSDIEPPIADRDTGIRFDSTVDNEDRPTIFAVFRDFQAVPLFLIEYRT